MDRVVSRGRGKVEVGVGRRKLGVDRLAHVSISSSAFLTSSAASSSEDARRAKLGAWAIDEGAAGLDNAVIPWLKQRDIAILGAEGVADVQPSGVQGINRPIHQLTQVNMGLPIVDNAWLEDAAREAARLKRWEFMFTLHIFQIQGGTASPVNALATF